MLTSDRRPRADNPLGTGRDVVVVMAGGAALGAYHMGVWQSLHDAMVAPEWVVGASVGAVTAAVLLGNPPEKRLDRLAELWQVAAQPVSPLLAFLPPEMRARLSNDYGALALLNGRPGMFSPRWPGPWSMLPFMPPDVGLRDTTPLRNTLERLVDFDRLNGGETRLSILATDVETGSDVWFDTADGGISVDHLLATTALMPLFPPVTIGGQTLCDAGLSKNLPLDRVFRDPPARDVLCLASDLFRPGDGLPRTIDETLTRVQDLAFWLQSRHSIDALQAKHRLMHRLDPDLPKVTLGYIAYQAAAHERSLKALDFSAAALARRAMAGRADMDRLLAALSASDGGDAFSVVTVHPADAPAANRAEPACTG